MRGGRSHAIIGLLAVVLVLAAGFNAFHTPLAQAGAPLYPDLQTAPPENLSIERVKLSDGKFHYLLRFDNTVENRGGRLEISADLAKSRDLYQNVYDASRGGKLVEHRRMMSDLIFHPSHNHFHVTDFASYSLYKKADNGVFRNSGKRGMKTSFCILDTVKVLASATNSPEYNNCNASKQGLSAGWGDTYTASLPDQWVDLGTTMAADGEFALHSTADPLDRIRESDNGNNTSVTLFSIKNGKLVLSSAPAPYCAAKPYNASVGAEIFVTCERLPANETFDVKWRYENLPATTRADSDGQGRLSASFVMPESTRGGHYLFISSVDSSESFRVSLIVMPTLTMNAASGKADQKIGFMLKGFSGNTRVDVYFDQSASGSVKVATVTTDGNGNGIGTVVIPSSEAGEHLLRAIGPSGSDPATATFLIKPDLQLRPNSSAPDARVQIRLRGFAKNESVVLTLKETGAKLGTIRVSNLGAANPSNTNSITIPADLKPGVYHVTAKGSTSGLQTSPALTIFKVAPTATPTKTTVPTKTATLTKTPTTTITPTPTATNTPEPTATETNEPSPTTEPTATSTEFAPLTQDDPDATPDP